MGSKCCKCTSDKGIASNSSVGSFARSRVWEEGKGGGVYFMEGETEWARAEGPPLLSRRLTDQAVKVGTRTRLLVEIASSSPLTVVWLHEGKKVEDSERIKLVNEGNFYCIDISPVNLEDEGSWTCQGQNARGLVTSQAKLTLVVPRAYKKPEFVEPLRAVLGSAGTVSLETKVIGVPTPTLKWYKEGEEIKPGDVLGLTPDPLDPSLGTYTCVATNCMGSTVSSSRVHVVSPLQPKQDLGLSTSGPKPIFAKELRNEKLKIGTTLILECQVKVPPWPDRVSWYNSLGEVKDGPRAHLMEDGMGGYSIRVSPMQASDDGTWRFVATNRGGATSVTTCNVSVSYPKNYRKPKFLDSLKAVLTEEGLVSFECKVVGYPTPQLAWFKDGQELKPGDVYQLTGTNSLGSYCCIARNCMGEAESTAVLTVEDIQSQLTEEERLQLFSDKLPPKFIQGLKSLEAKISEPFSFTVKVSVSPEPTILWFRDDEHIDESETRYKIEKDKLGLCSLHLSRLEFSDQAEWKCVAMNDFGQSVTSSYLKLNIPRHYKKPKFLEELRAVLSDEGAVNLECKVIGVPQPVLKWFKDGKELKPGDIHRIISGQDGSCCLGTYTCMAQNCMGTVSSSASLLGFQEKGIVGSGPSSSKAPEKTNPCVRDTSLSTIQEERTSQLHDTDKSLTLDDRPEEVSFSFDGREVSVSLYETPDLTEEEALQIVEMYADQISEHVSEHNVVELPPMRFTKESSTSGKLLMEAMVIDVSPDYFTPAEIDDLRTDADLEEFSLLEEAMITPEEEKADIEFPSSPIRYEETLQFPGRKTSQPSTKEEKLKRKKRKSADSDKEDDSLQEFERRKIEKRPFKERKRTESEMEDDSLYEFESRKAFVQKDSNSAENIKDKAENATETECEVAESGERPSMFKTAEITSPVHSRHSLTEDDRTYNTAEEGAFDKSEMSVLETLAQSLHEIQRGLAFVEAKVISESQEFLSPEASILESFAQPIADVQRSLEVMEEQLDEALIGSQVLETLVQPISEFKKSLRMVEEEQALKRRASSIMESLARPLQDLEREIALIQEQCYPQRQLSSEERYAKSVEEVQETLTRIIERQESVPHDRKLLKTISVELQELEETAYDDLEKYYDRLLACSSELRQKLNDEHDQEIVDILRSMGDLVKPLKRLSAVTSKCISVIVKDYEQGGMPSAKLVESLVKPLEALKSSLDLLESVSNLKSHRAIRGVGIPLLYKMSVPMEELETTIKLVENLSAHTAVEFLVTPLENLIKVVTAIDISSGGEGFLENIGKEGPDLVNSIDCSLNVIMNSMSSIKSNAHNAESERELIEKLPNIMKPIEDLQRNLKPIYENIGKDISYDDVCEMAQNLSKPFQSLRSELSIMQHEIEIEQYGDITGEKKSILSELIEPLEVVQNSITSFHESILCKEDPIHLRFVLYALKEMIEPLDTLCSKIMQTEEAILEGKVLDPHLGLKNVSKAIRELRETSSLTKTDLPKVFKMSSALSRPLNAVENALSLVLYEICNTEKGNLSVEMLKTLAEPFMSLQHALLDIDRQILCDENELPELKQVIQDLQQSVSVIQDHVSLDYINESSTTESNILMLESLVQPLQTLRSHVSEIQRASVRTLIKTDRVLTDIRDVAKDITAAINVSGEENTAISGLLKKIGKTVEELGTAAETQNIQIGQGQMLDDAKYNLTNILTQVATSLEEACIQTDNLSIKLEGDKRKLLILIQDMTHDLKTAIESALEVMGENKVSIEQNMATASALEQVKCAMSDFNHSYSIMNETEPKPPKKSISMDELKDFVVQLESDVNLVIDKISSTVDKNIAQPILDSILNDVKSVKQVVLTMTEERNLDETRIQYVLEKVKFIENDLNELSLNTLKQEYITLNEACKTAQAIVSMQEQLVPNLKDECDYNEIIKSLIKNSDSLEFVIQKLKHEMDGNPKDSFIPLIIENFSILKQSITSLAYEEENYEASTEKLEAIKLPMQIIGQSLQNVKIDKEDMNTALVALNKMSEICSSKDVSTQLENAKLFTSKSLNEKIDVPKIETIIDKVESMRNTIKDLKDEKSVKFAWSIDSFEESLVIFGKELGDHINRINEPQVRETLIKHVNMLKSELLDLKIAESGRLFELKNAVMTLEDAIMKTPENVLLALQNLMKPLSAIHESVVSINTESIRKAEFNYLDDYSKVSGDLEVGLMKLEKALVTSEELDLQVMSKPLEILYGLMESVSNTPIFEYADEESSIFQLASLSEHITEIKTCLSEIEFITAARPGSRDRQKIEALLINIAKPVRELQQNVALINEQALLMNVESKSSELEDLKEAIAVVCTHVEEDESLRPLLSPACILREMLKTATQENFQPTELSCPVNDFKLAIEELENQTQSLAEDSKKLSIAEPLLDLCHHVVQIIETRVMEALGSYDASISDLLTNASHEEASDNLVRAIPLTINTELHEEEKTCQTKGNEVIKPILPSSNLFETLEIKEGVELQEKSAEVPAHESSSKTRNEATKENKDLEYDKKIGKYEKILDLESTLSKKDLLERPKEIEKEVLKTEQQKLFEKENELNNSKIIAGNNDIKEDQGGKSVDDNKHVFDLKNKKEEVNNKEKIISENKNNNNSMSLDNKKENLEFVDSFKPMKGKENINEDCSSNKTNQNNIITCKPISEGKDIDTSELLKKKEEEIANQQVIGKEVKGDTKSKGEDIKIIEDKKIALISESSETEKNEKELDESVKREIEMDSVKEGLKGMDNSKENKKKTPEIVASIAESDCMKVEQTHERAELKDAILDTDKTLIKLGDGKPDSDTNEKSAVMKYEPEQEIPKTEEDSKVAYVENKPKQEQSRPIIVEKLNKLNGYIKQLENDIISSINISIQSEFSAQPILESVLIDLKSMDKVVEKLLQDKKGDYTRLKFLVDKTNFIKEDLMFTTNDLFKEDCLPLKAAVNTIDDIISLELIEGLTEKTVINISGKEDIHTDKVTKNKINAVEEKVIKENEVMNINDEKDKQGAMKEEKEMMKQEVKVKEEKKKKTEEDTTANKELDDKKRKKGENIVLEAKVKIIGEVEILFEEEKSKTKEQDDKIGKIEGESKRIQEEKEMTKIDAEVKTNKEDGEKTEIGAERKENNKIEIETKKTKTEEEKIITEAESNKKKEDEGKAKMEDEANEKMSEEGQLKMEDETKKKKKEKEKADSMKNKEKEGKVNIEEDFGKKKDNEQKVIMVDETNKKKGEEKAKISSRKSKEEDNSKIEVDEKKTEGEKARGKVEVDRKKEDYEGEKTKLVTEANKKKEEEELTKTGVVKIKEEEETKLEVDSHIKNEGDKSKKEADTKINKELENESVNHANIQKENKESIFREEEEMTKLEVETNKTKEIQEVAQIEAEEMKKKEEKEKAKIESEGRKKKEEDEKVTIESYMKKNKVEEKAEIEAKENKKKKEEEKSKLEAEPKKKKEEEEKDKTEAKTKKKVEQEDTAKIEAEPKGRKEKEKANIEAETKKKKEEEEKAKLEAKTKKKKQEEEKAKLEAEAKKKKEEQEKSKQEAETKKKKEEEEKITLEDEAKKKKEEEEKAKLQAEAKKKKEKEEKAKLQAEAKKKKEEEEKAKLDTEAKKKKEEEEKAKLEAEAKKKKEEEEKAKLEDEAKKKKEEEAKAKLQAEAMKKKEKEEKAKLEAEAKKKKEEEEKVKLEAEAKKKKEEEEKAKLEAEAKKKKEEEEKATLEAEAKKKKEEEEKAKLEAEAKKKKEEKEKAKLEAEAKKKKEEEEKVKLEAEAKKKMEEEKTKLEAEAKKKKEEEEKAKLEAEAKKKKEEEEKVKLEAEAKKKKEEEEKTTLEDEAKKKKEEEEKAKLEAEAKKKKEEEEKTTLEDEAKKKKEEEEKAKLEAEAKKKKEKEEKAKLEAEAKKKKEEEEKAKLEAEAKKKKEEEGKAKLEAEAKKKKEEEEKAKLDAEAKKKKEEEEKTKLEAEAKNKKEEEEKAKLEAEAKKKKEEEEKAKLEAEAKKKKEEEENTKQKAEEKKKKEEEEKTKLEAEAKKKKEEEEKAKLEAEAKKKKEEEEKVKLEAETKKKKEEEEKAKLEAEAKKKKEEEEKTKLEAEAKKKKEEEEKAKLEAEAKKKKEEEEKAKLEAEAKKKKEEEEKAKQEAEAKNKKEEEKTKLEAEAKKKKEEEEKAKLEAEAKKKKEEEEKAKLEAEAKKKKEEEEKAKLEAEAKKKKQEEEKAKLEAEAKKKKEEEEKAKLEAEAKKKKQEEGKAKLEAEAKKKKEEEEKAKLEAEAKKKKEEEEKAKLEAEAKKKKEEEEKAKLEAEAKKKKQEEEKAKLEAEAKKKKEEEEKAKLEAEAKKKKQEEGKAKLEAEAKKKKEEEEKAKLEAEAKKKKEEEEKAKQEAEAKKKKEEEEKAKLEAEAKKKKEEEEKAKHEAEAKKKQEDEEKAKLEAEAKKKKEEEEKAKLEAEAKKKKEEEEKTKLEAEAKNKKEEEEKAKLEAEAKKKKEEEEKAKLEAEAKKKKEEEEKTKQEAEAKKKKEEEEKTKLEAEAKKRKEEEEKAKLEAEAKKKKEEEEKTKQEAEAKKKKEEEEKTKLEAEAKKRKEEEEKAKLEAEAKKKKGKEEKATLEAEAKKKKEKEEKAKLEAEAKKKKQEEEKAKLEAEAKKKKEEEDKAKLEAEAKKKKGEEENAKIEAEKMKMKGEVEMIKIDAEAKKREEEKEKSNVEAVTQKIKEECRVNSDGISKKKDEEKAKIDAETMKKKEEDVMVKSETKTNTKMDKDENEIKKNKGEEQSTDLEVLAVKKKGEPNTEKQITKDDGGKENKKLNNMIEVVELDQNDFFWEGKGSSGKHITYNEIDFKTDETLQRNEKSYTENIKSFVQYSPSSRKYLVDGNLCIDASSIPSKYLSRSSSYESSSGSYINQSKIKKYMSNSGSDISQDYSPRSYPLQDNYSKKDLSSIHGSKPTDFLLKDFSYDSGSPALDSIRRKIDKSWRSFNRHMSREYLASHQDVISKEYNKNTDQVSSRESSHTDFLYVPYKEDFSPLAQSRRYTRRRSASPLTVLTDVTKLVGQRSHSRSRYEYHERQPYICSPLRDKRVEHGVNVKLTCNIGGEPEPTVEWRKDGQPIASIIDRFIMDYSFGVASLEIKSVIASDAGQYTCVAINPAGHTATTATLRVNTEHWQGIDEYGLSQDINLPLRVPMPCPKVTGLIGDTLVPLGGVIALHLQIQGCPHAEVTWLREGVQLKSSPRIHTFIDHSMGLHTFLVEGATVSEGGLYHCRVLSGLSGLLEPAPAHVQVVERRPGDKPALITARPETRVTLTPGEDLTLTCYVSGEPKPRVMFMKGIKDITDGDRTLKESFGEYIRLTLKRASPEDSGTYFIVARNPYGTDRAFSTVKIRERTRSLTPTRRERSCSSYRETPYNLSTLSMSYY